MKELLASCKCEEPVPQSLEEELPLPPVARVLLQVMAQVQKSNVRVLSVARRGLRAIGGERAAGKSQVQGASVTGRAAATARSGRSDSKWPGKRDKSDHDPNVPTVMTKWEQ